MLTPSEKETRRKNQYSTIINSEPGWELLKNEISKTKQLKELGMNDIQPDEYNQEKAFNEFDHKVYSVLWPTDQPYEIALKILHVWPNSIRITKNHTFLEFMERVRRSLAKRKSLMILYSTGCERCKHLEKLLRDNHVEYAKVDPNSPDNWRETKKADAMAFIIMQGYSLPVMYDGKTFLTYEQCIDIYKPSARIVKCKDNACSLVA